MMFVYYVIFLIVQIVQMAFFNQYFCDNDIKMLLAKCLIINFFELERILKKSLLPFRGMNLGFSSTTLLDQIHTTYDLLVINGSKVKFRGKNSIIHNGQNKGLLV